MLFGRMVSIIRYEFRMMLRGAGLWVMLSLLFAWSLLIYHPNVMNIPGAAKNAEITIFAIWVITNLIILSFFIFILFAGRIARDREARVSEILFPTGVSGSEYVWGKYLGTIAAFLLAYILYILINILIQLIPFFQAKIYGFHILRYFKMFLIWGIPFLILMGALSFLIGTLTNKPMLCYLLSIVYFILTLAPIFGEIKKAPPKGLAIIEPSGVYYNVFWDIEKLRFARSADWWNTHNVDFPVEIILSRIGIAMFGIGLIFALSMSFKIESKG